MVIKHDKSPVPESQCWRAGTASGTTIHIYIMMGLILGCGGRAGRNPHRPSLPLNHFAGFVSPRNLSSVTLAEVLNKGVEKP